MISKTKTRTRDDRAGRTQKKILRAAVQEFSTHGLSGARTDRIAESAKVNKALLYYYFKSKQGLYAAAVEAVAARVVENALAEFDPKYSAGERLLRSALNHFDRILTQREFQSLMQQEMVRFRSGKSGSIPILFRTAFTPLIAKMREATEDGIQTGEICQMDWLQVVYSIFGANVFYFLSAPMMELALPFRPFDPKSLKLRREVAVQFLGTALFTNRAAGMRLANRVLRDMPMPRVKNVQARIENFHARRKPL
ncbi:MAG: TetR/AcrR family transcriptional regulator [Acidobacteriaceae bacterium]